MNLRDQIEAYKTVIEAYQQVMAKQEERIADLERYNHVLISQLNLKGAGR